MTKDTVIEEAEQQLQSVWAGIDDVKNYTQVRVLEAFQKAGVQNAHFSWVTGYGYDDLGKDKLDEVYAHYFKTEDALVRPQLVSGTHAIMTAVLGNLKVGDEIVVVSGQPYDTLQTAFREVCPKRGLKYAEGMENLKPDTKIAFIQRSRGYEWRDSYTLKAMRDLIASVREVAPGAIVFVDNCYGEFTQKLEPTFIYELENDTEEIKADLIAGSLIKNPGGGLVAAGAYIAGSKQLVQNAADELMAPGIGKHGGCMFDQTRLFFQGFFMAPLIVSEALKGMTLAAKVFADMGLETIPSFDAERNDVIQAIKFGSKEKLINFCKLVQQNSPTNSMFSPIPDEISGYDDAVIMAAGAFVEGSSIELSADGPIREPYIGYLQGGLSYAHTRHLLQQLVVEDRCQAPKI